MLKAELTKNYAGITICGDYDDLDQLYDSIHYFIKEDPKNVGEYTMQNHLYGFLYEVRHAYQGQRDTKLMENGMDDNTKEWHKIAKKDVTDKNVYYSFDYILPDLLLDIILIKYFIKKVDKKERDVFNPHINFANFFYSIVLDSIFKILTPIKFNKIKKALLYTPISDNLFYPQWFEMVAIDYINMTKNQRIKEFMKIANAITNYYEYIDYTEMKLEIEKLCKEKNCAIDDFRYDNYPEDINW